MAKSDQGSAMPEDSIAAMPVGDEIALAVDLPEKPDESIFLDSVSWRILKLKSCGFLHSGSTKNAFYQRHPDPSWNSRTLVALISEWVTFTSAPQKFSRT